MRPMNTPLWPDDLFKLDLGDRMPNISGPDQNGERFSVLMAAPGPFAVLSVASGSEALVDAALRAFDEVVQGPAARRLNACIAVAGPSEGVHGRARALGLRTAVLADTRGDLARLFRAPREDDTPPPGLRGDILAMVTDPDQTLRAVIPFAGPEPFKAALTQALRKVEVPEERTAGAHSAPVLRVPGLLNPEQCQALIAMWETRNQPGKVGLTGRYGESVNKVTTKRVSLDHFVRDQGVQAQILATIGPRIREAVLRAFHFDVQHHEPLLIVAYPASEGGFFGAHRDNIDPAHMHRRFALTLNLNTGDYEGGGVWFPEYADTVYDPPAGDGIVFSCSLLHEAKAVTRGTRFILSGFMWGEAEEALRQSNTERSAQRHRQSAPTAG